MLRRAAKGTSWSQFLDYASPALFDVMPVRALFAQGREFLSNGSDAERFARVREEMAASLDQRRVRVEIGGEPEDKVEKALPDLPDHQRRDIGHRILEVYFAQVFASQHALLDLRTESFFWSHDGRLHWNPRSIYVGWQPEFLAGLRDLYAGFYLDDETQFMRGLEQLCLEGSGDALRKHLGSGDQRSVRFETSAFHSNFHAIFLSCRDRGVALHRNFLALGIYLVCLYDVLEALGLEFDVRGAFERAHA